MRLKDYLAKRFEPLLERLEDKLEEKGKMQKAQQLRHKQFKWHSYTPELREVIFLYFQLTYIIRFKIQREAYLQIQHGTLFQQLEANPSGADTLVTEMQNIQKQLQDINREIWNVERGFESAFRLLPEGPFKRALDTSRRNNHFYTTKFCQTQCVSVGGCCGRECGCCTRPRNPKRPYHFSHCTAMCKCCEDARGFKIEVNPSNPTEDPMSVSVPVTDADMKGSSRFYGRDLVSACVWGY
ncbi:hypothetical protein BDV32DRAFT_158529 [Aspergillus pseudonomiae]|nr:hypothetical protein BDV32DRAFT_158529 [Aspergillus pseudonomiae]